MIRTRQLRKRAPFGRLVLVVGCLIASSAWGQAIYEDPTTGDVGIGTQSPEAKLHIRQLGAETPSKPATRIEHDVQYYEILDNLSGSGARAGARAELELKAKSSPMQFVSPGAEPQFTEGNAHIRVDANHRSGYRQLTVAVDEAGMPITFMSEGTERMRIDQAGVDINAMLAVEERSSQRDAVVQLKAGNSWPLVLRQSPSSDFTIENAGHRLLGIAGRAVQVYDTSGRSGIELRGQFGTAESGGWLAVRARGQEAVTIAARSASTGRGGLVDVKNSQGQATVQLIGDGGRGYGRIVVPVVEITGGADLAERFEIRETAPPGSLVVIDPERPGALRLAHDPYDRKVAGIVSGAGGLEAGITLSPEPAESTNERHVALTGRVYALADADRGAIHPGDLLTTSPTPGHAMRVGDNERAKGAVVGKAMTGLDTGRGFVLVLVSLH